MLRDNNPVYIIQADATTPFPDWVKEAGWPTEDEVSGFPKTAFADVEKEFPIHTKSAAFLSYVYAIGEHTKMASDKTFADKLDAAAEFWDIKAEIEPYLKSQVKVASETREPLPEYALVLEDDDSVSRGWLKMSTSLDIEASAKKLRNVMVDSHLDHGLSVGQIKEACCALDRAATRFGAALDPLIVNTARRKIGASTAGNYAGMRKLAGASPEMIEIYKEAAAVIETSQNPEDAIEAWIMLDRALGVKYAAAVPNPWEIFYCGPTEEEIIKVAKSNVFVLGVPVPAPVVAAVPPNKVAALFSLSDGDIIKQACSMALEDAPAASRSISGLDDETAHKFLTILASV